MTTADRAIDAKTAALAGEANRLVRQGQAQAGARLWDQVLALSPEHAGALNFFGANALARGDLATAAGLLQRAIRSMPRLAIAHANYARVLDGQGDPSGALRELDNALRLEPSAYAVHFEKAVIYGQLGREKDQALAYESALQLLPESAAMSRELQPLVERAQHAVRENKSQLGRFLDDRLSGIRSDAPQRALARFNESLDVTLGRVPLQLPRPSMFHITGLPPIAFFEREDFDWAPGVEAGTDDVRRELEQVLQQDASGFIPYVQSRPDEPAGKFAALDYNPDWSAYFLWQHGVRIDDHAARCPRTMALLDLAPQVDVLNRAPAAFFSALKPRTRIPPHTGATNCRLTVHLPLVVPNDCALQVGNHVRGWTPGELLIFDDTMEHAAWNNSDQLRVVMIFDIWHPMLSAAERNLVKGALEGLMAYYGKDAPLGEL